MCQLHDTHMGGKEGDTVPWAVPPELVRVRLSSPGGHHLLDWSGCFSKIHTVKFEKQQPGEPSTPLCFKNGWRILQRV